MRHTLGGLCQNASLFRYHPVEMHSSVNSVNSMSIVLVDSTQGSPTEERTKELGKEPAKERKSRLFRRIFRRPFRRHVVISRRNFHRSANERSQTESEIVDFCSRKMNFWVINKVIHFRRAVNKLHRKAVGDKIEGNG